MAGGRPQPPLRWCGMWPQPPRHRGDCGPRLRLRFTRTALQQHSSLTLHPHCIGCRGCSSIDSRQPPPRTHTAAHTGARSLSPPSPLPRPPGSGARPCDGQPAEAAVFSFSLLLLLCHPVVVGASAVPIPCVLPRVPAIDDRSGLLLLLPCPFHCSGPRGCPR